MRTWNFARRYDCGSTEQVAPSLHCVDRGKERIYRCFLGEYHPCVWGGRKQVDPPTRLENALLPRHGDTQEFIIHPLLLLVVATPNR